MHKLLIPLYVFIICLSVSSCVLARECEGKNLNSNEKIRIGIIFRPESCNRKTSSGDRLKIHYTLSLYSDCTKVDSSYDKDMAFEFQLGAGQVIKGFDRGLINMCLGETRKLIIPDTLAYGIKGAPPKIPGGATMLVEVHLVEIINPEK